MGFNLETNAIMKCTITHSELQVREGLSLASKAEKLREQKKGLMQVLLTGRVRLNYDK